MEAYFLFQLIGGLVVLGITLVAGLIFIFNIGTKRDKKGQKDTKEKDE